MSSVNNDVLWRHYKNAVKQVSKLMHFVTNLLPVRPMWVQNLSKSVMIWQSYWQKFAVTFFMSHSVIFEITTGWNCMPPDTSQGNASIRPTSEMLMLRSRWHHSRHLKRIKFQKQFNKQTHTVKNAITVQLKNQRRRWTTIIKINATCLS